MKDEKENSGGGILALELMKLVLILIGLVLGRIIQFFMDHVIVKIQNRTFMIFIVVSAVIMVLVNFFLKKTSAKAIDFIIGLLVNIAIIILSWFNIKEVATIPHLFWKMIGIIVFSALISLLFLELGNVGMVFSYFSASIGSFAIIVLSYKIWVNLIGLSEIISREICIGSLVIFEIACLFFFVGGMNEDEEELKKDES